MKVIALSHENQPQWQEALSSFERQFHYPLSDSLSFSIDHGPDYSAFFRSQGDGHVFAAVKDEQVIGVLACAIKSVVIEGKTQRVAYLGDTKLDKSKATPFTLYRLFKTAQSELQNRVDIAYSIVMDGTEATPQNYTGKMDIPLFEKHRDLMIVRIDSTHGEPSKTIRSSSNAYDLYTNLCTDIVLPQTQSHVRSLINPCWFFEKEAAVGLIEDTRRAKRLHLQDGAELVSSHLSFVAFNNVESAEKMIKHVLHYAHILDIPGVFMALTTDQYHALQPFLESCKAHVTKGTIYGTSPALASLTFNTAEV